MGSPRLELRKPRRESRDRIVAAATALVRTIPYSRLTVEEVMREAGLGRTIYYRHFDDLADLMLRAAGEAIEALLSAQPAFADTRIGDGPDVVRAAIEPAVAVYERHGPLLRAIAEAAADDEQIAAAQNDVRRRFDALVEEALRSVPALHDKPPADFSQTARALGLMNESYLLDAFGREPRICAQTAVHTLTEIWVAVISHPIQT